MQGFWQLAADQHTVLFARTFLALVLLGASGAKLLNLRGFVAVVRDYRLLPESMVGLAGRLLPVTETVVAVGFLLGTSIEWVAMAAMCLFLLFGGAVAINLLRGRREISCGCFGPNQNHHLTWGLVARNGILAGLASLVWLVSPRSAVVEPLPNAETAATMLIAGAALACWWLWRVILRLLRLSDVDTIHLTISSRDR